MAYGPARQDIRATCAWTADCNILPVGADVGRATLQAMLAIGAYGLLQGWNRSIAGNGRGVDLLSMGGGWRTAVFWSESQRGRWRVARLIIKLFDD